MNRNIIVAIDGPAASGKSTTAKLIAMRLGLLYIDSGAMYRAVTLKCLNENVDVNDTSQVVRIAEKCNIDISMSGNHQNVFLDGIDVTQEIRLPEISKNISPVAANSGVRDILVRKQQELGKNGNIVMDGRDIGTIVFPHADIKIFLVASPEARARRRYKELKNKGLKQNINILTEEIFKRDEADYTRNSGPLRKADDAIVVDNSDMSVEEQVNFIIDLVNVKFNGLFNR